MASQQNMLGTARGFGFRLALGGSVALTVGLVSLGGALAASPLICKPLVSATGTPAPGPTGKGNALQAWKDKVTGLYGAAFANYSHARSFTIACTDVTPKQSPDSPPLVKVFQCTVKGRPCNK